AYEVAGEGEPLVLVHGSWGDRHSSDSVFDALARSFRVVRYDRRGHSHSESERPAGRAHPFSRPSCARPSPPSPCDPRDVLWCGARCSFESTCRVCGPYPGVRAGAVTRLEDTRAAEWNGRKAALYGERWRLRARRSTEPRLVDKVSTMSRLAVWMT